MTTGRPDPDATRHRVLEAALLRLAGRPNAADFVLRGGVLLRHWVRPLPRPAHDLDLLATFPFGVDEAAARFLPALAEPAPDGVTFDTPRTRLEGIWLDTGCPGMRVFATAEAAGEEVDFGVDITFGPAPRPAPVWTTLPTAGGPARVLACRPETVAAHKVQALHHLGMRSWRPKDLNDLRLILARVPTDHAELGKAVAAYLADVGATAADARALFGPDRWWGMKLAAARWRDFARSPLGCGAADGLAAVLAEVAGRLAPALEGLP